MLLLWESVCTCGLAGIRGRHVLAIEEALLFDGLTHRHVAGQEAVEILVESGQLHFSSRCSGQRADPFPPALLPLPKDEAIQSIT